MPLTKGQEQALSKFIDNGMKIFFPILIDMAQQKDSKDFKDTIIVTTTGQEYMIMRLK